MNRYELAIVTSTSWYPVLTACSPTSRIDVLHQLADAVTELRKGRGVDYDLIVCEVTERGYSESSIEKIHEMKKRLK